MAKKRKQVRTIVTDIFGRTSLETPINSKKKGEKNERACAKWLGEWVGQPFTRVPASGGMRWKDTANVCGDVVCEVSDFNFIFTVETKHLKSIPYAAKLRSNSKIYGIWRQSENDAERARKEPMLIIRENGMESGKYICCFHKKFINLFDSNVILFVSDKFFGVFNNNVVSYGMFTKSLGSI